MRCFLVWRKRERKEKKSLFERLQMWRFCLWMWKLSVLLTITDTCFPADIENLQLPHISSIPWSAVYERLTQINVTQQVGKSATSSYFINTIIFWTFVLTVYGRLDLSFPLWNGTHFISSSPYVLLRLFILSLSHHEILLNGTWTLIQLLIYTRNNKEMKQLMHKLLIFS